MNEASRRDRFGTALLGAGALAGVVMAAVSLVHGDGPSAALEVDVVATVDGQPIPRVRYERALAAVAADRHTGALRPEDRERVLSRLIEEELLVARALELGLHSRDPRVRNDLTTSMIDRIKAHADRAPPDRATLRAFYGSESRRFVGSPRFEVEHAFFSEDVAEAEARARRAVSGGALRGDAVGLPLPAGPLSGSTLTQRLGPTAARGIAELAVGETGGPWRTRGGWHVARLVARRPGALPSFESIEEHVATEYARVRAERELRAFLDERRAQAEIVIGEVP